MWNPSGVPPGRQGEKPLFECLGSAAREFQRIPSVCRDQAYACLKTPRRNSAGVVLAGVGPDRESPSVSTEPGTTPQGPTPPPTMQTDVCEYSTEVIPHEGERGVSDTPPLLPVSLHLVLVSVKASVCAAAMNGGPLPICAVLLLIL